MYLRLDVIQFMVIWKHTQLLIHFVSNIYKNTLAHAYEDKPLVIIVFDFILLISPHYTNGLL